MTPSDFCRALRAEPGRYHIPAGDPLWGKALEYFASRPLAAAEFEALLAERRRRDRTDAERAGAEVAGQLLERWRHFDHWPAYARAVALLRQMLGAGATFRDGQWEAIHALTEARQRVLVVQKTGWGKSVVYFIATRLLRDGGAGPSLLISPLLSLMRNQIEMARRIGIRAATLNSENAAEWDQVEQQLGSDECDVLLVSPERLASEHFQQVVVPRILGGIGLFGVAADLGRGEGRLGGAARLGWSARSGEQRGSWRRCRTPVPVERNGENEEGSLEARCGSRSSGRGVLAGTSGGCWPGRARRWPSWRGASTCGPCGSAG